MNERGTESAHTARRFATVSDVFARYRPAILAMVAGVSATLAMSVAVYSNQSRQLMDRAFVNVTFAAQQINQLVSYLDVTAGSISSQIFQGEAFADLQLPRSFLLSDSGILKTILVIDASGTVVTDFRRDPLWLGADVSDTEFFQTARSVPGAEIVLGTPSVGHLDDSLLYPLSSSVADDSGNLVAVVVMMLNPSAFNAAVREFIGRSNVEVILVDQTMGTAVPLLFQNPDAEPQNALEQLPTWERRPRELVVGKTIDGHAQMNLLAKQPILDMRIAALNAVVVPALVSILLTSVVAFAAQVMVAKSRRLATADSLIADTSQSIPGIIMRFESAQNGQFRAQYVSDMSEDILEIRAADILEDMSRFWSLVHEDDAPFLRTSLQSAGDDLIPWMQKWRIVTPSKQVKWLQARGMPKQLKNGSVLWNAVVLEITELVTAQDELSKAQETVAFSKRLDSVGRLTAGIAHEFNNLMAVVMGNVELVLENDQVADKDARRMLNDALTALRRGARQTSDLLKFGRKARLHPEVTTLNKAVENLQPMLGSLLNEQISINYLLETNPWCTRLDVSQLESAIINIVLNSRDALLEGGTIQIQTENRKIETSETRAEFNGDYVVLTVSDDGIGMSDEVKSKAIDPYFTTKPIGQGTGLGLSAVHGFVNQTAGELKLDSSVGSGTTVQLWFPRADFSQSDHKPSFQEQSAAALSDTADTVLLVEDNSDVRTTLKRQLLSLGYRVQTCGDGQSALNLLRGDPSIKVVLSDIVMPGAIQGDQLADLAKKEGISTPFVLITGYGDFEGMQDVKHPVLNKPTSTKELAAALRMILNEPGSHIEEDSPHNGNLP